MDFDLRGLPIRAIKRGWKSGEGEEAAGRGWEFMRQEQLKEMGVGAGPFLDIGDEGIGVGSRVVQVGLSDWGLQGVK